MNLGPETNYENRLSTLQRASRLRYLRNLGTWRLKSPRREFIHVAHLPAFTLVEMVVSLAIMSILMLAMGSAMLLAGQALPAAGSTMSHATRAGEVADRIASELSVATKINTTGGAAMDLSAITSDATSDAVKSSYSCSASGFTLDFFVPDRDGDGNPEEISYTWSGTPGDPLTRSYNGHSRTILDNVGQFKLTYGIETDQASYPGPANTATDGQMVFNDTGTTVSNGTVGQYLYPMIPANAVGWRPTRASAKFYVKPLLGLNLLGIPIELLTSYNVTATLVALNSWFQSARVLDQQVAGQGALLGNVNVTPTFYFSGVGLLAPNQGVAVSYALNGCEAYVQSGAGLSIPSGGNWPYNSSSALVSQLDYQVVMPGAPQKVVRCFVESVQIQLQCDGQNQPVVTTRADLLNRPQIASPSGLQLTFPIWQLDFSQDPTPPTFIDLNGDGHGDWATGDDKSFDMTTLIGGKWLLGATPQSLHTTPGDDFSRTTRIMARMQDTTSSGYGDTGDGVTLTAAVEVGAGQAGVIIINVSKQPDGGQTLRVEEQNGPFAGDIGVLDTVQNLFSGFVDVRLLIDPSQNTFDVTANGQVIGMWEYNRVNYADAGRITLGGTTGGAFSYVSVREEGL